MPFSNVHRLLRNGKTIASVKRLGVGSPRPPIALLEGVGRERLGVSAPSTEAPQATERAGPVVAGGRVSFCTGVWTSCPTNYRLPLQH